MKPEHQYFRTSNKDAWEKLKNLSRENRKQPTKAEAVLWQEIRSNKLGQRFRRQHSIDFFIVDFICLDKLLIIEVDGGYHNSAAQKEADEFREMTLRQKGYTFLRFTNEEVLNNLGLVVLKIELALKASPPPTPPLP